MKLASSRHAGRGGGRVFLLALIALLAPQALAADVLFPKALHLTRRIEDPFAAEPIVVDEYCAGNRMVTVRGDRVVIADYDKQEITEIDRAAATYSITRFDEIAKAVPAPAKQAIQSNAAAPAARPLGTHRTEFGQNVERFEIAFDQTRIEVGIDRTITLNPAALEVLLGAAYPNHRTPHHHAIAAVADAALPAEQIVTIEAEGTPLVVRNVVTRVAADLVPVELTAIPAGAKRIESRYKTLAQVSGDLDRR